jgi:hypothetical protein
VVASPSAAKAARAAVPGACGPLAQRDDQQRHDHRGGERHRERLAAAQEEGQAEDDSLQNPQYPAIALHHACCSSTSVVSDGP